jgi:hypothetical protein
MENSYEQQRYQRANQVDLVDYLAKLGFEPKRKVGNKYYYLSPLREEKTASFKVERKQNIWADFGAPPQPGKKVCGGTMIDFGMLYYNCTAPEFLERLEQSLDLPISPQTKARAKTSTQPESEEDKISILKIIPLEHPALLSYIAERRIPFHIANEYCKEVHFSLHGKANFAIGFKSKDGGYELRNKYFKGSSSPKNFTHLQMGAEPAKQVAIFEGFFSFLSYVTLIPPDDRQGQDVMVLNTLVFFESARPVLENYKTVNLFLDNNAPGKKVTAYARSINQKLYKDRSAVYKKYDDFNDLHCHFGDPKKKRQNLSK